LLAAVPQCFHYASLIMRLRAMQIVGVFNRQGMLQMQVWTSPALKFNVREAVAERMVRNVRMVFLKEKDPIKMQLSEDEKSKAGPAARAHCHETKPSCLACRTFRFLS
jgi:hypothetical protein